MSFDLGGVPIPLLTYNPLQIPQMHQPLASTSIGQARPPIGAPTSFEFTRRKRWADLLVMELPEALLLVLSPMCKIWYCGNSVTELLGWKDHELVDCHFIELMNVADRANFGNSFAESVQTCQPLLAYARLTCKPAPTSQIPTRGEGDYEYASGPVEVLFEIRARVHVVPNSGVACVFAVASPYPSRTTAMVNTFLELKMENEHLHQRLRDLRAQDCLLSAMSDAQASSHAQYRMGAFPLGTVPFGSQSHEDTFAFEDLSSGPNGPGNAVNGSEDGDMPKKKFKRLHTVEQHVCVTCGRTDSPEWRKGPLGPKTLCNACGLRWAKKAKKMDDGQVQGVSLEGSDGSLIF